METVFEYINERHYEDTLVSEDGCDVDSTVVYTGSVSDEEYRKAKKMSQERFNLYSALGGNKRKLKLLRDGGDRFTINIG